MHFCYLTSDCISVFYMSYNTFWSSTLDWIANFAEYTTRIQLEENFGFIQKQYRCYTYCTTNLSAVVMSKKITPTNYCRVFKFKNVQHHKALPDLYHLIPLTALGLAHFSSLCSQDHREVTWAIFPCRYLLGHTKMNENSPWRRLHLLFLLHPSLHTPWHTRTDTSLANLLLGLLCNKAFLWAKNTFCERKRSEIQNASFFFLSICRPPFFLPHKLLWSLFATLYFPPSFSFRGFGESGREALLSLCRFFRFFPGVPLIWKLNDSTQCQNSWGTIPLLLVLVFSAFKKKRKKRNSSFALAKHSREREEEKETQSQSDDYSEVFCWALLNLICPPAQRELFQRRLGKCISINAACVSKLLCCGFP